METIVRKTVDGQIIKHKLGIPQVLLYINENH